MEPHENFKNIKELSNGKKLYHSYIYKLPTIDPVIDKNEIRLGYINLNEFKRFLISSHQNIRESLGLDDEFNDFNDFHFCEIESNTYGTDIKVTILPVKDSELF